MAQLVGSSRSTKGCRTKATEKVLIRCASTYSHGGLTAGRLDPGTVDAPKREKKVKNTKLTKHYSQVRIRRIKPTNEGN